MGKKIEISVIVNSILFIAFILLVSVIGLKFYDQVYNLIREPAQFRELILSYGQLSILIFILFQVLQVVVATIPGEFVQIAGGYIYGTWAGTIYSALGIILGYLIVFSITRLIGYPLVKVFISARKIEELTNLIHTKKSDALIFLLFLLPGIPKDFLVYAAGLTPLEPGRFFAIVALARFPALFGASFMGAHLEQKNYAVAAITFGLAVVFFGLGILWKDQLLAVLEKRLPKRDIQKENNREPENKGQERKQE